jgi:hypothetical protein
MQGRGRVSSIDRLPEEADDDVVWACEQLYQRQRDQQDILAEFNDRLAAKGLGPISRSAFGRQATRLAAAQRRMRESRAMFEGLSSEFTATSVDENTIILGEFIKTLITELVDDSAGRKSPKEAMELARAFHATVSAQKVSAERRMKVEAEAKAKMERAVEAAVSGLEASGHAVDAKEVLRRIRAIYDIHETPE